MSDQFERTRRLIGEDAVSMLKAASVIVFGVGGVGGFVCEALVRAGVGRIDIVDKDTVDITNINRQIIATHDTVGRVKVEVMKERMLSINPDVKCEAYELLYLPETAERIDFSAYDYVIDCIDNVTAKLDLIGRAKSEGCMVISSMGTGNKLDPLRFKIADISKTSVCPLAKVMRKELKKRSISNVKVLYSDEEPTRPSGCEDMRTPASISFVPSAAGLIIAGEVIKDIAELNA